MEEQTSEQNTEEKKTSEEESAKVEQEGLEETQEAAEASEENVANLESKKEEDYKEKYYYLAAEMQNLQRRYDREKGDLLKYGNEKILKDLIDIVDNFERTLGFIKNDEDEKVKNLCVGIEMINNQFLETLGKHGLKQVDAIGKDFDPNFHEALAQQPAEGKKDMEVIQVHQAGYTLNERLIRPAKVIVAKN